MKQIGVYCGSQTGRQQDYQLLAKQFAATLVKTDIGLVHGGARIEQFILPAHHYLLGSADNPEKLLDRMGKLAPVTSTPGLTRDES